MMPTESPPAAYRASLVLVEERNWPEDAAEIARLAAARIPRLLFVAPTSSPPETTEYEEDWIRLPASPEDIAARRSALEHRVTQHFQKPTMDGYQRVHFGGRWVRVGSLIEQRILRLMIDNFREVVTFEDLIEAGWAGEEPTMNAVRVHITRLSQQVEPISLRIARIRGTGYVLEHEGGLVVE